MYNHPEDGDIKLLDNDRYTFLSMRKLAKQPCRLFVTDHVGTIILQSSNPYPVWVWLKDNDEERFIEAFNYVLDKCPINGGYCYQMKNDTAEMFIQEYNRRDIAIPPIQRLSVYAAEKLVDSKKREGNIRLCTYDDENDAAEMLELFFNELGIDRLKTAGYHERALEVINMNRLFFGLTASGTVAGCCRYSDEERQIASIGMLYVKPKYRRNGIAENMVYSLSSQILESGMTPVMYSLSNNEPVNKLFEKLGYECKGSLCRLG